MTNARCRRLSIVMISVSLALLPAAYGASQKSSIAMQSDTQEEARSNETFPQVVRISYAEGDVRVARGQVSRRTSKSDWEVAVSGLPVETGYYLATGDGRAEIEFEDASTVYLAENSVLAFNDLHSTGGKPYTNIALLTGTATLHVIKSDSRSFIVNMPANRMYAGYQRDSYLRITSFTDGFSLAPRDSTVIRMPDSPTPERETAGNTIYFRGTTRIPAPQSGDSPAMAKWDKWVDERVTARSAAMTAVMNEAGLSSPLPGLADLNGRGRFFKCEPYGTCWEPATSTAQQNPTAAGNDTAQSQAPSQTQTEAQVQPQAKPSKKAKEPSLQSWYSSQPPLRTQTASLDPYSSFPCGRIIAWSPSNPRNGKGLPSAVSSPLYPIWQYDWALCHAGTWIFRDRRYLWVAPQNTAQKTDWRRIHYRPPVRWVKIDHTTAFVPLHPHDVRGKAPLNTQHGVFAPEPRNHSIRSIEFSSRSGVKVLDSTPRVFLRQTYAPLTRTTEPLAEVHPILTRATSTLAKAPGIGEARNTLAGSLTFDHRSQSFQLARTVMQGGKSSTVTQPFAGRNGDLQTRVEGVDSRGGYSMRVSSGSIGSSAGTSASVGSSSVGGPSIGGHGSLGSAVGSGGGGGFSTSSGSVSSGGGVSSFGGASAGGGPSAPAGGGHH